MLVVNGKWRLSSRLVEGLELKASHRSPCVPSVTRDLRQTSKNKVKDLGPIVYLRSQLHGLAPIYVYLGWVKYHLEG